MVISNRLLANIYQYYKWELNKKYYHSYINQWIIMNPFNKPTQCRNSIVLKYGLYFDNKYWLWSGKIFLVSYKAGCLETWRAALVFFLRTMCSRLLRRTTTVWTLFEGTRGEEAWGLLRPETHLQSPTTLNPQETVQHEQGARKGTQWPAPLWLSLP